jgi:hypothetical protein
VANLGQIRGESGGDSWRIMRFSKACITFLAWRIWGRFVANPWQIRGEFGADSWGIRGEFGADSWRIWGRFVGDSWRIMRFSKACITFLAWRIRGESGADSWRIRGRFFGVRDFLAAGEQSLGWPQSFGLTSR